MSSPRRPGADAPARLADVETLRRLTRDAFAEITSVRDRLRDLERSVATERASRAADRARVDTRAEVCTASPARGRRDAHRRESRVRATTTVETPFDDGDALFVRLATSAADGRGATSHHATTPRGVADVALDKLAYRRRCGPDAWVRLVLVGAEGHDAAATLSPTSKGATLSGLGSKGAAALAEVASRQRHGVATERRQEAIRCACDMDPGDDRLRVACVLGEGPAVERPQGVLRRAADGDAEVQLAADAGRRRALDLGVGDRHLGAAADVLVDGLRAPPVGDSDGGAVGDAALSR